MLVCSVPLQGTVRHRHQAVASLDLCSCPALHCDGGWMVGPARWLRLQIHRMGASMVFHVVQFCPVLLISRKARVSPCNAPSSPPCCLLPVLSTWPLDRSAYLPLGSLSSMATTSDSAGLWVRPCTGLLNNGPKMTANDWAIPKRTAMRVLAKTQP